MTSVPSVSIGIPAYEGERYLPAALDALLGQTYEDFELVIGDNASSDTTLEISREYAARDPRVRVLRSDENRGAAWNYNRVFHASEGAYFRWAACDDLVAPEHLERLVLALSDAPPTTLLVQTGTVLIDEDGREIGVWDDKFDLSDPHPWRRLRQLVRHLVMSNVFFGLVRRSAMEKTRLHGAYPSADYVLLAELALLGEFLLLPERLFMRRVHPGMSRLAHASLNDVADWFQPGSSDNVQPERLRLFFEHLQAIRCSPLRTSERLITAGTFLPVWLARHKGAMARELWAYARTAATPRPSK